MVAYTQYGIKKDIPPLIGDDVEFLIQDLGKGYPDRYIYPNDTIKYDLDGELVLLYDRFRDLLFPDTDEYYRQVCSMPIFVQEAGQDARCAMSCEEFKEYINKYINIFPDLYKYIYLVDCQFLVGSIQNLLNGMEQAFVGYYMQLAEMDDTYRTEYENDIITVMSPETGFISSSVENYFTKAASILDRICKIAYELERPQCDFTCYKKLRCSDKLWGYKKKLTLKFTEGTLFEECDIVNIIESIRNETVHNGTWELNPKVFVELKKGQILQRYMLFPDFENGHLATVKNRNHFFGAQTKVNDILPQIHLDFKTRLLHTICLLNTMPGSQNVPTG